MNRNEVILEMFKATVEHRYFESSPNRQQHAKDLVSAIVAVALRAAKLEIPPYRIVRTEEDRGWNEALRQVRARIDEAADRS